MMDIHGSDFEVLSLCEGLKMSAADRKRCLFCGGFGHSMGSNFDCPSWNFFPALTTRQLRYVKHDLFRLNRSEATNIGRHNLRHGLNGCFSGNYSPLLAAEQHAQIRKKENYLD